MTLLKEGISQAVLFVMPGHSWWEVHIPSLINIANKWVTEVCCDDTEVVTGLHWWHAVTGRKWGVVTLAPSPDMHRWCPHDMSMISVQLSVCHCQCGWLPVCKRREQSLKMSRGRIFFSTCWVMRILVSMWHSPLSVQWVRHIPCWLYMCTHCLYTQCTCVHPVTDNTLSSEETSTRSTPVIIAPCWEQVKQWDQTSFTIDRINHCKNQKSQRVIVRCDQYASKVTR